MGRRKGDVRSSSWNSLHALGPLRRCALVLRGECRCAWCVTELDKWTTEIDHVVPRRAPFHGSDRLDNLVPACAHCNEARHLGEGRLRDRLADLGLDLEVRRAEVIAQCARAIDREAGRLLALQWYAWYGPLLERNKAAQKARQRGEYAASVRPCGCAKTGPPRRGCNHGLDASFDFWALAPETQENHEQEIQGDELL